MTLLSLGSLFVQEDLLKNLVEKKDRQIEKDWEHIDRLNTALDDLRHRVEVRRIRTGRGTREPSL